MPSDDPPRKESRRERRRREREEHESEMTAANDLEDSHKSSRPRSKSTPITTKRKPRSRSASKKPPSRVSQSKPNSRRASPPLSLASHLAFDLLESEEGEVREDMDEPKAGPSKPSRLSPPRTSPPISTSLPIVPPVPQPGFDDEADFVAFEEPPGKPSESGRSKTKNSRSNDSEIDSGKGKGRQSQPAREWDRGKPLPGDDHDSEQGRRRGDNHRGTKRNHHSVGENDDVTRDETRRSRHSEALRAPWVEWMSWENCHNVAEMMHDEIEAFVKWASPTKEEDEMRGLVVRLIQQAVTKAYPDAQVLPFGSFATKLYLPLGDIDLVILSDKLENGYKDYVLRDLAHVVKRAGITSNVTIISKARVPIIKFTSTHGSFHVDISIGQIGGLKSVDVVNNFLKTMSLNSTGNALRALVLIAKAFLSQRSMNEVYTGGLGSYSIVCLAISFLQMHPKIRRGEIDPDKNMGVLVVEFFELYGCYFNYDEVGISVREGGMYFRKKQRGWLDYYNQGLLSIEDPVDPTNDISKGSFAFQKVKTTMAGAFGILSTKLYQRAALLRSRRSGSGLRRDDIPPEDVSILSSVLRITQETINHRRLVEEQYHSRTLQKILGTKTPLKEPIDVDAYEDRKPVVPSQKRVKEVQSVASAWQEAEGELSIKGASARLAAAEEAQLVEDSESDGGRYNIGRQPPRKRQKVGRKSDQHTVFVVDDDGDSLAEEEEHYASDDVSDADSDIEEIKKPTSRGEKDRNRSFWLSKAINSGHEST